MRSLILWAAIVSSVSVADSLEEILDHLKITELSEFRYVETREMKLLSQPQLAQGNMYVSSERMVIAQDMPKQSMIMINGNRLQYLEPARGIRFVKRLNSMLAAPGIGSFLSLLQAQMSLEQLQAQFLVGLEQHEQAWKIILTPRAQTDIARMEISGPAGGGADQLKLGYVDGDVTTWSLSRVSEGLVAQEHLDALLKQVRAITRPEPSAKR